jgi:hypothetical protein
VALSLKETRAISGLADTLYEFLPGSGRAMWRGHVNFGTVAAKVGVGDFWQGGSKKPVINFLLSQTLEYRRGAFQNLILEIVRCGLIYRQKQHKPITITEIDDLNGHILELVLHHNKFDGRYKHRVQSGQPIHRRTTSDAPKKIPCHA